MDAHKRAWVHTNMLISAGWKVGKHHLYKIIPLFYILLEESGLLPAHII